jgi:hypothetical protein
MELLPKKPMLLYKSCIQCKSSYNGQNCYNDGGGGGGYDDDDDYDDGVSCDMWSKNQVKSHISTTAEELAKADDDLPAHEEQNMEHLCNLMD